MSDSALSDQKSTLWWAARREFTIKSSILSENVTEVPDGAHVSIGGNYPLSTAALDIEPLTMPRAMIVTVLRLPARTVGRRPLWR